MLQSIVCPISSGKMDSSVIRLTGLLIVVLLCLYLLNGAFYLLAFVAIDYFIRSFPIFKYSPVSGLGLRLSKLLAMPRLDVPKAPKLFAARIGFLMAFAALFLQPYSAASYWCAGILTFFAFLESAFDFCVGCLLYTWVYKLVRV